MVYSSLTYEVWNSVNRIIKRLLMEPLFFALIIYAFIIANPELIGHKYK